MAASVGRGRYVPPYDIRKLQAVTNQSGLEMVPGDERCKTANDTLTPAKLNLKHDRRSQSAKAPKALENLMHKQDKRRARLHRAKKGENMAQVAANVTVLSGDKLGQSSADAKPLNEILDEKSDVESLAPIDSGDKMQIAAPETAEATTQSSKEVAPKSVSSLKLTAEEKRQQRANEAKLIARLALLSTSKDHGVKRKQQEDSKQEAKSSTPRSGKSRRGKSPTPSEGKKRKRTKKKQPKEELVILPESGDSNHREIETQTSEDRVDRREEGKVPQGTSSYANRYYKILSAQTYEGRFINRTRLSNMSRPSNISTMSKPSTTSRPSNMSRTTTMSKPSTTSKPSNFSTGAKGNAMAKRSDRISSPSKEKNDQSSQIKDTKEQISQTNRSESIKTTEKVAQTQNADAREQISQTTKHEVDENENQDIVKPPDNLRSQSKDKSCHRLQSKERPQSRDKTEQNGTISQNADKTDQGEEQRMPTSRSEDRRIPASGSTRFADLVKGTKHSLRHVPWMVRDGDHEVPFFMKRYPRYCEIQSFLREMARKYSHVMRIESIGVTLQGRRIDAVILQKSQYYHRGGTLLEAGIHAREWLTHTTVLYFLYYILNHQEILDRMDFYIIPCLNPDGYEYTHVYNRLWRKNLNPNWSNDQNRWGVDLNRNFPYQYGMDMGSSSDSAHPRYRGRYSMSEPESRSLVDFLKRNGKYIQLYIAVHTYGNLILYPWGFSSMILEDHADLVACGRAAINAIKAVNAKSRFVLGSFCKALYYSSGSSADYARGAHNIKFSYTIELHRGGPNGFDAPPEMIPRVAEEAFAGIYAMMNHVHDYYVKHQPRKIALRPCHWKELDTKQRKKRIDSNSGESLPMRLPSDS